MAGHPVSQSCVKGGSALTPAAIAVPWSSHCTAAEARRCGEGCGVARCLPLMRRRLSADAAPMDGKPRSLLSIPAGRHSGTGRVPVGAASLLPPRGSLEAACAAAEAVVSPSERLAAPATSCTRLASPVELGKRISAELSSPPIRPPPRRMAGKPRGTAEAWQGLVVVAARWPPCRRRRISSAREAQGIGASLDGGIAAAAALPPAQVALAPGSATAALAPAAAAQVLARAAAGCCAWSWGEPVLFPPRRLWPLGAAAPPIPAESPVGQEPLRLEGSWINPLALLTS